MVEVAFVSLNRSQFYTHEICPVSFTHPFRGSYGWVIRLPQRTSFTNFGDVSRRNVGWSAITMLGGTSIQIMEICFKVRHSPAHSVEPTFDTCIHCVKLRHKSG